VSQDKIAQFRADLNLIFDNRCILLIGAGGHNHLEFFEQEMVERSVGKHKPQRVSFRGDLRNILLFLQKNNWPAGGNQPVFLCPAEVDIFGDSFQIPGHQSQRFDLSLLDLS